MVGNNKKIGTSEADVLGNFEASKKERIKEIKKVVKENGGGHREFNEIKSILLDFVKGDEK